MKWVAVVVGVVVVLVLVVVVIGMLLPQSHIATRTAHLKRPPADVWAAISDVAAHASWRKDVKGIEMVPTTTGRPAWRETSSDGVVNYEADDVRPPAGNVPGRFASRITDKNLPYGGAWTIEVAPDAVGTRVTITERGEVYNPVFRFVSRFVIGRTATIDAYLKALGRKFGEDVSPADASPGVAA